MLLLLLLLSVVTAVATVPGSLTDETGTRTGTVTIEDDPAGEMEVEEGREVAKSATRTGRGTNGGNEEVEAEEEETGSGNFEAGTNKTVADEEEATAANEGVHDADDEEDAM